MYCAVRGNRVNPESCQVSGVPVSLTSFELFHPCGISFSTVAQHLHQLCQCSCWRLPNKSGFRHNYALSTEMAGVLLSSQCLQLGPIASFLHLNFSCLSRNRIHPITDVWVDYKPQMETLSLFLSASPHTTKPVWICFLIVSQLYLLLCHPITCLYCFSSLFNCSQFFQCCLPPIHFLRGSQKDGFKWESDCALEILQWLAAALGLKIKDIHLAFTFQPDFTPVTNCS